MRTLVALCLTIMLSVAEAADDQFADISVNVIPVGGSVTMLVGARGGNGARRC